MMKKIKIALLVGGLSKEREVSINTGKQIYQALDKNKYIVFRYDPKYNLKKFINDAISKKFDLVFPALHGPLGEDGKMQGLLDILGLNYTFSGTLASSIAMNKKKSKIITHSIGINVLPDIILHKKDKYSLTNIIKKLSLPIVVKPNELGSSVGITIAKNKIELKQGINNAFRVNETILLEKFIKGRELTVAILEIKDTMRALPVIEIIPKVSSWFDYKAKYEEGGSDEICPAKIPKTIKKMLQNKALNIFNAIGCKDLARADFIWDNKKNIIYFLEINTIPGMTKTSLVPKAAKTAGIKFDKLLENIINNNLR